MPQSFACLMHNREHAHTFQFKRYYKHFVEVSCMQSMQGPASKPTNCAKHAMQVAELQELGRACGPGTRNRHVARSSGGGGASRDWEQLHELMLREITHWLAPTDCRRARLVCKHWCGALDTVTTSATTPPEGGTVSRWKACLESMAYSLPCLKEVTVSGKLSDVGAQQLSILAGCKQLRTLRISQGQALHDSGLQALQQLTQLEVLHIYAAPSLTGRALCTLSILGKLRTLDLRGCSKISWVDLQQAWVAACVAYRQRGKAAPVITVRRKSSNGGHITGLRHLTLMPPGGHSHHSPLARSSSGGGGGGSPRSIMKQRAVMFAASAGVPARLGRKSSSGGTLQHHQPHQQQQEELQGKQGQAESQQQDDEQQGQKQQEHVEQEQQGHVQRHPHPVAAPLLRRKSSGSALRHHHVGLRAHLHHVHTRQPSGGGAGGLTRTPSGMPTAGMLRHHHGPAGHLGGSSLAAVAASAVARQKSSMQAALLAYMAGDYSSDEEEEGDDADDDEQEEDAAAMSASIGAIINGSSGSRAKVLSAPPAMPFPRLQALSFTCSEVFSSRPAAELKAVAAITTLTTLELLRCRHISDKALLELASLPRLSKLKLSGAWSLTDAGVEALASELRNCLTSLVMLNPVQLSGRGVLSLAGLTGLAHLGLCITQDVGTSPLLQMLAALPKLRTFDLTYPNWNDTCCEGLAAAAPALSGLKLHGCASLISAGVATLRSMTALTSLSFDGCKALHAGALLVQGLLPPKLASLSLQGSPFGNMYGSCVDLPVCAARLTRLELLGCNDLHDSQLRKVVSFYPALQELSLAGCVGIGDAGAAAVAASRQLRTLDLSGTRVTGGFADAVSGLRGLTQICMRNCSFLADAGLRQVAAALPRLQVLEVAECGGISDRGVAALFEVERLGRLDVSGCKKVTAETLLCAPHTLRLVHTLSAASGHNGR